MSKPRLLDLFCCAGGAAKGYQRAGFHVVGVDVSPQPRYCGDEFHQADAMVFPLQDFDVIHASPPCQAYSTMTKRNGTQKLHPEMIEAIRFRLVLSGKLYVIENVVGAPLLNPITLCGTSFGLRLKRHRLFESNVAIANKPCRHADSVKDIEIMNHGWKKTRFVPVYGSSGCKARHLWNEAMGIDWMNTKELTEAIPPAYTEYIGQFLLAAIRSNAELAA